MFDSIHYNLGVTTLYIDFLHDCTHGDWRLVWFEFFRYGRNELTYGLSRNHCPWRCTSNIVTLIENNSTRKRIAPQLLAPNPISCSNWLVFAYLMYFFYSTKVPTRTYKYVDVQYFLSWIWRMVQNKMYIMVCLSNHFCLEVYRLLLECWVIYGGILSKTGYTCKRLTLKFYVCLKIALWSNNNWNFLISLELTYTSSLGSSRIKQ